jgi:hypothetical protein
MMREPSCSSAIAEPSAIDRWEPLFDSLSTPLGFVAGDANVRRITGNDPINFMDPTGEIPVHGNDGVWRKTESPTSPAGPQFRGNGYWHSTRPNVKPIQFAKDIPNFTPHLVKFKGETLTVKIPAQGTSGADLAKADEFVKSQIADFPGAQALKGTWHHKAFSASTGNVTLELVRTDVHSVAKHSGAFAQYLDWAADVTMNGKPGSSAMSLARRLTALSRAEPSVAELKGV